MTTESADGALIGIIVACETAPSASKRQPPYYEASQVRITRRHWSAMADSGAGDGNRNTAPDPGINSNQGVTRVAEHACDYRVKNTLIPAKQANATIGDEHRWGLHDRANGPV